MEASLAPDPLLVRVSERIAQTMGLHFPPERSADLRRGLEQAAPEFGLLGADACSEWVATATLTYKVKKPKRK